MSVSIVYFVGIKWVEKAKYQEAIATAPTTKIGVRSLRSHEPWGFVGLASGLVNGTYMRNGAKIIMRSAPEKPDTRREIIRIIKVGDSDKIPGAVTYIANWLMSTSPNPNHTSS